MAEQAEQSYNPSHPDRSSLENFRDEIAGLKEHSKNRIKANPNIAVDGESHLENLDPSKLTEDDCMLYEWFKRLEASHYPANEVAEFEKQLNIVQAREEKKVPGEVYIPDDFTGYMRLKISYGAGRQRSLERHQQS